MSIEQRRTELVYSLIQELVEQGKSHLRPGDVNALLRERGAPLGTWEVRAEFTELEQDGRIVYDADTGDWHLNDSASLQDAAG